MVCTVNGVHYAATSSVLSVLDANPTVSIEVEHMTAAIQYAIVYAIRPAT